jgi:hypothetical protein
MEKKTPYSYKDYQYTRDAVDIYKDLKGYLITKYPTANLSVVHMAACLLEETLSRALPHDANGDVLVSSAKMLAPSVVTEVIAEEATITKPVFTMPGTKEIH